MKPMTKRTQQKPMPKPVNLKVKNITAYSALLIWEIRTPDGGGDDLKDFCITARKEGCDDDDDAIEYNTLGMM